MMQKASSSLASGEYSSTSAGSVVAKAKCCRSSRPANWFPSVKRVTVAAFPAPSTRSHAIRSRPGAHSARPRPTT